MFFRVIRDDNTIILESNSMTKCMEWMVSKAREYNDGYVTWFEAEHDGDVITMSIAGVYYKVQKVQGVIERT